MRNKNYFFGSFIAVFAFVLWVLIVDENGIPKPVTDNQESKIRTQEVKYINACRVKGERVAIIFIDTITLDMDYDCTHENIHSVATRWNDEK